LDACKEAVEFAAKFPTLQAAWDACDRGDWLLWLLGRLSGPPGSESRRKLVLAACACARLALPHVKAGEDRPRLAIETAERWARQEDGVTLDMVRSAAAYAAAYAASDAAYADAYAASDAAAYADAYAAYAAGASANAAAYAANAAGASANAAYAAADAAYAAYAADHADAAAYAAAARTKTLKDCAEIVRKMYQKAPELARR
jgi:hypothetical protein